MQKIDKSYDEILSIKYKNWVDNLEKSKKKHPESRTYYDDVVMELFRCQKGVCAYTEMFICPPSLYNKANWINGEYKIPDKAEFDRTDHLGELEHFNSDLKTNQYWLWDNLLMIHAKINGLKSNKAIVDYLKPDSVNYSPEKYFDYDEETHRFIPNTDIDDEAKHDEIQYMIDNILYLNHGVARVDRENFIKDLKFKIKNNLPYNIDRFFTATKICLSDNI